MNFMDRLHNAINDEKKLTENGARGYAATGSALVDLNFAAASLRSRTAAEIVRGFIPAFYEDRVLAIKWLFFLRDVRGGLGERRSFRIIIRYLAESAPELIGGLIDLMAEYGRYDDLLCLFYTPLEEAALTALMRQLERDVINSETTGKVSLCAKWMPGNNTSSPESRIREELELALAHSDCTNTNIEATFELILQTAVRGRLSQQELPGTVLVISDMEFDMAVSGSGKRTLFDTIGRRFAAHSYRMPKLVFWNVNSRTNVIPVRENELGVALYCILFFRMV